MVNKENYQFQVNMKGMIELLSEHIYSSPTVFIRELLQNGMDAVTVRKGIDESHQGVIDVTLKGNQLIFEDNGVGLTQDDMHQFLSVIGQSSKKGELAEKDLIGQFGIGLLSCLVVSEEIKVESRSLFKEKSLRWTGFPDGTYKIENIDLLPHPGTRVILKAKKNWEHLFSESSVKENILYYGSALPIEVNLSTVDKSEQIIDGHPIWLNENANKETILDYGKEVFKQRFLDAFPLSAKNGDLKGIAYILPNKVNATIQKAHKVYVKRMFLGEETANLLPEWSSFVRCIINTNKLKPTASRESLMNNAALRASKKELSECFKNYLRQLSFTDTHLLQRIIRTHHIQIKELAAKDQDILQLFGEYLPFETNRGMRSFGELIKNYDTLFYTSYLDDFRQIRRIAGSQNKLVVNTAYVYETDLFEKLARSYPNRSIKRVKPSDLIKELEVIEDTKEEVKKFLKKAAEILHSFNCKPELRNFTPVDTPVLYITSENSLYDKQINHLSDASNPFAAALSSFKTEDGNKATLCFNHKNELIGHLILLNDQELFEALIKILYVQAQMLGGYPINQTEMNIFNQSLHDLMIMGISFSSLKL